MYARVLTPDDEKAFNEEEGSRLQEKELFSGQLVVIRLHAPRASRRQFGVEYGGIFVREAHGENFAVVKLLATESVVRIPLIIRSDGRLMSQGLPPHPPRLTRMGLRQIAYPEHTGQPRRPFGYILSAEHATDPINEREASGYIRRKILRSVSHAA